MKNSINDEWKDWTYRQLKRGIPKLTVKSILQKEQYSQEIINKLLSLDDKKSSINGKTVDDYDIYFQKRISEMNLNDFEQRLLNNLSKHKNADLMSLVQKKKIVVIDNWLDKDVANELHDFAVNASYKTSGGYEGAILNFHFMNIVQDDSIKRILFLFNELFPGNYLFNGSIGIAKYSKGSHIEEHTDHGGYVLNNVKYQRNITGVLYLNKRWYKKNGGYFHDLENNKKIYPKFNRAVFFEVPHKHLVSAVLNDIDRYSIFMFYSSNILKYNLPESRYKRTGNII